MVVRLIDALLDQVAASQRWSAPLAWDASLGGVCLIVAKPAWTASPRLGS